jgi:hypothetical protein
MSLSCPLCQAELGADGCPTCGLAWRAPSGRSAAMGAAGSGASPGSLAFRPRLGEVLATLGAFVVGAPVVLVVLAAAVDGSVWSRRLYSSEIVSHLVVLLVLLVVAAGVLWFLSHVTALVGQLIAPRAIRHEGEILEVRPGGLDRRGRAWIRLAKADLGDALLDPHQGGYLHDLLLAHRAGPALLLATEMPPEDAERAAATIAGWLGKPAGGGYRKAR